MSSTTPRVWVITGASSGIGKELTLEALRRGDRVVAVGRSAARLQEIKGSGADILEADVNAELDTVKAWAVKAIGIHGKVDILVNNAAYVAAGTLEETTPEEVQQQFNTNVFAVMNVTRAFLPHFRARRSGVIANVGSIASVLTVPACIPYYMSKAALRSMSLNLATEVKDLGISSIVLEFGYVRTNLLTPGMNYASEAKGPRISDYDKVNASTSDALKAADGHQSGDPVRAAKVTVDVLTQTGVAKGREIPTALALGSDAVGYFSSFADAERARVDDWASVSKMIDFPEGE